MMSFVTKKMKKNEEPDFMGLLVLYDVLNLN